MKLYHFYPNNFGDEYYVMAEDKVKAHEYLLKYFQKMIDSITESTVSEYIIESYGERIEIWKNVNPLDASTFPQKYTLNEFGLGDVIESEIA